MGILEEYIANGCELTAPEEAPPVRIDAISAQALSEKVFAPLVEPVKGLICEGLTLLCGASKVGKSWFSLQMCASVADGAPFLGRQTQPGPVLYLAYEDSERRLQYRQARQFERPGLYLEYATQPISVDAGLIGALDDWMLKHEGARLIVIDTLQKIRGQAPARANAYGEDYKFAGTLKRFADAHHIAVVLVHHFNKMRDTDDPFDRISGSTGLMGAADTVILLARGRGESIARVTYTGRDVWGDDFSIRFDDDTCIWSPCDERALARMEYEKAPIVQAVRQYVAQESVDGRYAVSWDAFRLWALDRGLYVGATQRETRAQMEKYAAKLGQFDDIHVSTEKRIGTQRGFTLTKGAGL